MQSEAHVPWFRVVFEMTDGSLMEFQMQQGDFRELALEILSSEDCGST